MYSDGITEARRQGSREFFGDERFRALLSRSRSSGVEQAVKKFSMIFKEWLGDTRPPDDITLLIVEPVPAI